MFGWLATSTIFGVMMHWEQSSVGKVSESMAMWPPMEGSRSTRMTWWPQSAMSSAAWMPAMPPPMTSARLVMGTVMGTSFLFFLTRSTMRRTMSVALAVASSRSSCTQEQCSRMFAISHRNGFSPAARAAFLKVFSCMRGEHAATTRASSFCSTTAFFNRFWPGSEHMYL